MATFSKSLASCGGVIAGPADVIEFLRIQSRPFMFTASSVPAAVGAALAAVRICRSTEGRELFARVLDNARYLHRGLSELGFRVVEPTRLADGTEIVTPVVPVVVGDDWNAGLLWKALYDAGVFVNTALHPAVPPGRRAAAHQRDGDPRSSDARPGARDLRRRPNATFEAEHGPLPGPISPPGRREEHRDVCSSCSQRHTPPPSFVQILHKRADEKKHARSTCSATCDLAVTGPFT